MSTFGMQTIAGDEISRDLIQMLKRKLDDAVLDNLTLTLSRNPMYKLTPEDVQVSMMMKPEFISISQSLVG